MDFLEASIVMVISLIPIIIINVLILVLAVSIANYIGLSSILWWAFTVVFWLVITSILNM